MGTQGNMGATEAAMVKFGGHLWAPRAPEVTYGHHGHLWAPMGTTVTYGPHGHLRSPMGKSLLGGAIRHQPPQ